MNSPSNKLPECSSAGQPSANIAGTSLPDRGLEPTPRGGKRKRRGWRRALLLVVLLGVCLYWFRAPILRSVAGYLIVDDPVETVDYVLILPGVDKRYDRAAQLYQAGSRILLQQRHPSRLEKMGIKQTFEALSERELTLRGVPHTAITLIPGDVRTDWDRARSLRAWLHQQPNAHVAIICDRFGGRRMRHIYNEILGREDAGRIRFMSLPDRTFDETNWWRIRVAVVDVFTSYLRLGYVCLCGEEPEEGREWDPEEYQKTLH